MAKPVAKMEYYKVLYEFDPRNPDEMALEEGDIVVVRLFCILFVLIQGYCILHTCLLMNPPSEQKCSICVKLLTENIVIMICSPCLDCLSVRIHVRFSFFPVLQHY